MGLQLTSIMLKKININYAVSLLIHNIHTKINNNYALSCSIYSNSKKIDHNYAASSARPNQ